MDKCQLIDIPSDPEKKREWMNHGSLAAANRGVAEYELSE